MEADTQSLEQSVSVFLQFPNTVFTSVISLVIPVVALIALVTNKRFVELFQALISLIFSVAVVTVFVEIIKAIDNPSLTSGYISMTSPATPSIPIYLSFAAALLVICGPKNQMNIIRTLWWVMAACSLLLSIFGILGVMAALLSIQIGVFVGLMTRFALGQMNHRTTWNKISKILLSRGIEVLEWAEITTIDNPRCRYWRAEVTVTNEDTIKQVAAASTASIKDGLKSVIVQVYDFDKQSLNFLQKIWRFIKFKNVQIKYTSKQSEFEHIALMNYSAINAGMNVSQLITATTTPGSSIFVFDNTEKISTIKRPLEEKELREFWQQLAIAHRNGITLHSIPSVDLVFKNDLPSISSVENAELDSNSLFKRLDLAQLLAALTVYADQESVIKSYLEHVNLYIKNNPKKDALTIISETIAGLNSINIPASTRSALKNKYPDQEILEDLKDRLNEIIDNDFDEGVRPVTPDYRRLSAGKIVTLALTVFAVMMILMQLDWDSVVSAVTASNPLWTVASIALSFITFLGGSIALKGFGHKLKVNISQVYFVQIAASWAAVQLPAALGPVTMNIRYLNRVNPGNAKMVARNSAVAGVVQVAQAICSFGMLLIFAFLTGRQAGGDFAEGAVIMIVIGVILGAVLVCMIIPPLRTFALKKVKPLVVQFVDSLRSVFRSPRYVLLGFMGCIIQELGYALSLWGALMAFGQDVSLLVVIFVFLVANAAGSAVPIPGGLGAYEAALTLALSTVGVPPAIAISTTLLYRIATFWIRVPMGILTQKILEKREII
jgi:uncharacterized protein (TIRG00374 family)